MDKFHNQFWIKEDQLMDRLTEAKKHEARAKELRRKEKEFWDEVDRRKAEILEHWGMSVGHAEPDVTPALMSDYRRQ